MFALLLALAARAEEPAASPATPPDPGRLEALERDVEALRTQLQKLEQDAFLREAEALAASVPPQPPPRQTGQTAFNPALTAFGDVLGSVGIEDQAVLPGSGPWVRSLELDLRADVDPFAKAVAVLAVEQEPPLETGEYGAFEVAPEELYVDLIAFPAGFSARAGQFRQPFGVTNRAHPHDRPWPDAPAALVALLGEEGFTDVGATLTWRAPTPSTGLSWTGGVLRGVLFDEAEVTANPGWIGRAEWFHEVGNLDVALGASGTGLEQDALGGADLVVRYRQNSWRSVLLLAEVLTDLTDPDVDPGGYLALQVQPTRPLYLGIRGDLVGPDPGLGAYLSYYTSEFLRMRLGGTVGQETAAHAQLTFVWGSHPVEPYWVNR